MARPRRTDAERIEDLFFDMNLAEQDKLLATLATLHRLKRRQASDKIGKPGPRETPADSPQPMLSGAFEQYESVD